MRSYGAPAETNVVVDLTEDEAESVGRVSQDSDLLKRLGDLITPRELAAFTVRCQELRTIGTMPEPSGEWPAIPWPAF